MLDLLLICLRNQVSRALGSHGQICDGFAIDLLENSMSRAQGFHGQICNGFAIYLLEKFTLESPGLSRVNTHRFVMDLLVTC